MDVNKQVSPRCSFNFMKIGAFLGVEMPLERSKTHNDTPTIKDIAFQRIKLISESTQYFFMIFFLNWKVISSRPSFQLSSHLEYVFILKKIFKNYFYPDKVCSLLLTVSIWPF